MDCRPKDWRDLCQLCKQWVYLCETRQAQSLILVLQMKKNTTTVIKSVLIAKETMWSSSSSDDDQRSWWSSNNNCPLFIKTEWYLLMEEKYRLNLNWWYDKYFVKIILTILKTKETREKLIMYCKCYKHIVEYIHEYKIFVSKISWYL